MAKNSAIDKAVKYIKSSWQAGKTLKEIAEFHGVNAGNLERAFHDREGVTVKHFVDQRRKEYVISQLARNQMRGYEIGVELGFANDLAFYRWVSRAFGISFVKLRRHVKSDFHKKN